MVVYIPLVLRVRAFIEAWEYGWVGGGVLVCGGICCGDKSRWMCVSFGCVLGSLGCRGFSLGLFGGGVGVVWVGREVDGSRRVGFHAMHSRMLSCVEGTGFFVCLIWVRRLALGPRVWACGLSVAIWLVLGGVVGWLECGWAAARTSAVWGGSACVCVETGVGEVFDLGQEQLGVWVIRVWGYCVVWVRFPLCLVLWRWVGAWVL